MIHLVKGVFLLCFREVCGVIGSVISCSLALVVSSSLPKLFVPLLPMPLAPLQPWEVLLIFVLHSASSRWRIENLTKPMAVCSNGRELSEPSYILNTCEGAQYFVPPMRVTAKLSRPLFIWMHLDWEGGAMVSRYANLNMWSSQWFEMSLEIVFVPQTIPLAMRSYARFNWSLWPCLRMAVC